MWHRESVLFSEERKKEQRLILYLEVKRFGFVKLGKDTR
jgi:hypothetical protein